MSWIASFLNKGLLGVVSRLMYSETGPLTAQLEKGRTNQTGASDNTVTSVCGFCSTGCGLQVTRVEEADAVLVPSSQYPVNRGMACPKGWAALQATATSQRATTPLVRTATGRLEPVDWPSAISRFVSEMKGIQEKYGPDSIAYLSSGQITVEEIAYLGTLARVGMQMHHGDSNTRQCMATAVSAYTESFGFDAPPYTYADFEASDLIILVGSNLCIAHPILWHRILSSRRNPTIVVIDPRTTETAMAADIHLPLAPKSDLRLFYRLANLLIEKGHLDERFIAHHTEDFGAFKSHVSNYGSEDTAEHTNIADSDLDHLAELIGSAKRTSFWWTMGVNQSHEGVRVAQAIINLALMTGNIGKPGTGANSITGQCNAMGSRLFGNTTNLLGGHDFH